jgi:hypothetical protein
MKSANSKNREERLAEALRANLRRRKVKEQRQTVDEDEQPTGKRTHTA